MSRHPSRRRQLNTFGSQARRANGSGEQVASDFDELKMLLDSPDQEPLIVKGPIHVSTPHATMQFPSEPVTGVTAHTDQIRRGMEEVLADAEPPMVQNASVTHMDVRDRRIETLPQPDILYCVVKTVKDQCDSMEVLMDEIMKEIDDSMRVVRSEGGHRMTVAFWEDTPGMRAYAAYLNEVLDRQSAPDLIIWIQLPYGLVIPTYQLRGAMMENYHVKVHTLHNTFMLGD